MGRIKKKLVWNMLQKGRADQTIPALTNIETKGYCRGNAASLYSAPFREDPGILTSEKTGFLSGRNDLFS
ncbi:MAG: hypothetical protein B6241_00535 [Spirochaetaceae bacterium 4572_59]|nr:MAG: hypothetical protein B6241_00535 [Spirochaetaceae bacterium 4572_59]